MDNTDPSTQLNRSPDPCTKRAQEETTDTVGKGKWAMHYDGHDRPCVSQDVLANGIVAVAIGDM